MSTHPTPRLRRAGLLAALTMTAALAACSSPGSNDSASSADDGGTTSAEAPVDQLESGSERSFADSDSAADAPTASKRTGGTTTALVTERAVISTGAVSWSSDDVREARRDVQRIIDASGGVIADEVSEVDEKGRAAYARLVVRVPSARFTNAMNSLEASEDLVSSNRGSEDVTTQVIDTDVRVRAQEASLKRVELLLSRADSLKDIIWIESQLTRRQADLDSLKSQQAWLQDQTSLSTITIDITRTGEKVEEKSDEAGFLAGLRGGLQALGASLVAVATIVGALLPFAVVFLAIGLPIWFVVRRRRTDAATTPATEGDPAR